LDNAEKETAQKYHSAVITLKFFAGELTREQEIGIFWRLAGKAEKLVHNEQEKPYMFYLKQIGEGIHELNISSINPDIIEAFVENARSLIEAGEGIDVQGIKIRPLDVFPVKDLDFIGEKVVLATETGCCCCKRIRTKTGKRSRYYLNPSKESDAEEWKAIIARKLSERAAMFMGEEVPPEDIQIDILQVLDREFVKYKSARLPTDKVQIEIAAPSPVIFTAIYGGIGSHTGAGFGAVRVSKRQLARGAA